jgi:hypothetical protein
MTAKEFSVLSNMPRKEAETLLNELFSEKLLEKGQCKNGSIWRKPMLVLEKTEGMKRIRIIETLAMSNAMIEVATQIMSVEEGINAHMMV